MSLFDIWKSKADIFFLIFRIYQNFNWLTAKRKKKKKATSLCKKSWICLLYKIWYSQLPLLIKQVVVISPLSNLWIYHLYCWSYRNEYIKGYMFWKDDEQTEIGPETCVKWKSKLNENLVSLGVLAIRSTDFLLLKKKVYFWKSCSKSWLYFMG